MSPQLVWLITGTSSGFGHDLALAALKRGEKVIATARAKSIGQLDELRAKGADVLELDVTASLEDLRVVAQKAIALHGHVDVVVNNAGYGGIGVVEETTPEDTFRQFNTNVFGALNVARAFLAHMRERKAGTIAWIGSYAGWFSPKGASLYSASKHALRAISQSLDEETKGFGVRSIIFEPGYFRTKFITAMDAPRMPRIEAYVSDFTKMQEMLAAYDGNQPGNPAKAADTILDIVRGEGVAAGRDMPDAIPLGTDALEGIKDILKRRLAVVEEWEQVSRSTDSWD
ncbi:hypothetical protein K488DRAFT_76242 [Vararia minispora EC-137]|uniref:Uncharacterized protein n=1 Tax=Vararia minispora EC-137 TaxID=1314806 RepID=A0ACB8QWZ2_9AGAM|nr:hypothetical protein K488DRAFT_76242 [Vararia minispora EC-137]